MGYGRAISNIKSYDKPIFDASEMKKIPFCGDAIQKKVKEFLEKGEISKLQTLKEDPKLVSLEELAQIWGVGSVAAQKLYSSGIKTIDELKKQIEKKPDLLNKNQTIGLKYYEDFNERMPRDEASKIASIVKEEAKKLFGNSAEVIACGSYRRGK